MSVHSTYRMVLVAILKSAGAIVILNIVAFSYPRTALYGFVPLAGTVFLPLAVTSRERASLRVWHGDVDLFFFVGGLLAGICWMMSASTLSQWIERR